MVVAQDEQPKPAPIDVPDLYARHDQLGAAIRQHLSFRETITRPYRAVPGGWR